MTPAVHPDPFIPWVASLPLIGPSHPLVFSATTKSETSGSVGINERCREEIENSR